MFVAYFPHLVAGPILRASTLLPQIAQPRASSRRSRCATALWLIAWGFFQKIFVADNLAAVANARLRRRARITRGVNVLLGTYAFAFQIYGDFAGYSNIARGIVEADGHRADRELPLPVPRAHAAGILAPLAHQPVDLAARLPLHPARRQPRVGLADATATC